LNALQKLLTLVSKVDVVQLLLSRLFFFLFLLLLL
jgi:hypothetical protein